MKRSDALPLPQDWKVLKTCEPQEQHLGRRAPTHDAHQPPGNSQPPKLPHPETRWPPPTRAKCGADDNEGDDRDKPPPRGAGLTPTHHKLVCILWHELLELKTVSLDHQVLPDAEGACRHAH